MAVSLFKPTLKRKDMDYVLSCMVADQIAAGQCLREFVQNSRQFMNAAGGAALASYYSALKLSFEFLKLESGDAVVLSPLSPSLHMAVIESSGLIPLFADVDENTGLLTAEALRGVMERKPKAVLLHYTLGFVPDVSALLEFGIPVIEDISQALGARCRGEMCGSLGNITVCSLNQENIITTGCGGLVLLHSKKDDASFQRLLDVSPEYELLPDLNASIGIAQLKELNRFLTVRREIGGIFSEALMRSRHSTIPQPEYGENVPFSFPVVVDKGMNEVRKFMRKKGIETHAAFKESVITMHDEVYNMCPNAKRMLLRCVLFPLYPSLGKKNIENITKVLPVLP